MEVSGAWSNGATGTDGCITGATISGECQVLLSGIRKRTSSVTFTVNGATHTVLAYDDGPDSMTVLKP